MKKFVIFLSLLVTGCQSFAVGNSYQEKLNMAKESEGLSGIGLLQRSQSIYYQSNATFTHSIDELNIKIPSKYYNFEIQEANEYQVIMTAEAKNVEKELTNFVGVIDYNSSGFFSKICKSKKSFHEYINVDYELSFENCDAY